MLVHSVYFTLHDSSPEAKEKLLSACRKYLVNHPGTVFFSVSTLAAGYDRPVNDLAFDVALTMAFDSRASHDAYQTAPRHQQFIAENKADWKQVRVFDSEGPATT